MRPDRVERAGSEEKAPAVSAAMIEGRGGAVDRADEGSLAAPDHAHAPDSWCRHVGGCRVLERRWQGVGRGVALAYNPLMSEPSTTRDRFYVTTPIYYVNDRPHVGHCYSTLLADTVARFMRASGRDVFFLTGTDEHSERVASRAAEEGMTPIQWADRNAGLFKEAFAKLGFTNDDFIRTTESRHKDLVTRYVRTLLEQGDVYLGEYSGWWDHSQEEYLTETVAREHGFKSPVTGKDLVKRTEKNYFFRLGAVSGPIAAAHQREPGIHPARGPEERGAGAAARRAAGCAGVARRRGRRRSGGVGDSDAG